jgi:NAD(P)-dependent dehydrogenase (short-subunit alcohol dehydrogenase family)
MAARVILITGANGGLGRHVTEALLSAGAVVAGSSRRIADGDFGHANFHAFPADLGYAAQVASLAEAVVARLGRIDALVHTAGGFSGGKPVHETENEVWEQMLNLNLRTTMNVLRAVIPHMRNAGGGRIVAIGSRAAVEPAANIAAYSASKAALVSLVKTVALENRDAGITANVILPGTIDTEANRSWGSEAERKKWVSPRRLAELAVFLVSDAAAEITGAAIPVYGAGV